MAAEEYVSISAQANVEREKIGLVEMPKIHKNRGLIKETTLLIAKKLTVYILLDTYIAPIGCKYGRCFIL